MRINLIKEEKRKINFNLWRVILVILILIPILLIGYIHYSLILQKNNIKTEINNIENQLNLSLPRENEYKKIEQTVKKLKEVPAIPEYNWNGPVKVLGYITPLRGVIDDFSLNQNNLNIRGRTRVGEELRKFREDLSNSRYFVNVSLKTMEKQKIISYLITADLMGEGGD